MSEKADWFVYTEGDSWGHPVGYGQLLKDMTIEEVRKFAFKQMKAELSEEGALNGQTDDLLYLLGEESENDDSKEELESTMNYIQERCFILKVGSSEPIPVRPALESLRDDIQDWQQKEQEQRERTEKAQLKQLMQKYPELTSS